MQCCLLNTPSETIHAVLAKNQLCGFILIFASKCQDRVDSRKKESAVTFREDFKLFLPSCLGEQVIALL